MIFPDAQLSVVPLHQVGTNDDYFKISKPLTDALLKSVKKAGVIENVILCAHNDTYITVCGHNRISAAKQEGMQNIPAKIIHDIAIDDFLKIVRLKLYAHSIGAVGRCKILLLLFEYFNVDKKHIALIGQELSVPSSMINKDILKATAALPKGIKDYIDSKSLAVKCIPPLLRLPAEAVLLMESIIAGCQLRTNYFNNIVIILEDICRLGKCNIAQHEVNALINTGLLTDDALYKLLYSMRYSHYTQSMSRINEIRKKLLSYGIKVEVPEYLEGDGINAIIEIKKNKPINALLNNDKNITELLSAIVNEL